MTTGPRVSDVTATVATDALRRQGLLAWVSLTVDDSIRVDGLTLRRTADGRPAISFPYRRDSAGREHFYLRPLDDASRRDLEGQILDALVGIEDLGVRR